MDAAPQRLQIRIDFCFNIDSPLGCVALYGAPLLCIFSHFCFIWRIFNWIKFRMDEAELNELRNKSKRGGEVMAGFTPGNLTLKDPGEASHVLTNNSPGSFKFAPTPQHPNNTSLLEIKHWRIDWVTEYSEKDYWKAEFPASWSRCNRFCWIFICFLHLTRKSTGVRSWRWHWSSVFTENFVDKMHVNLSFFEFSLLLAGTAALAGLFLLICCLGHVLDVKKKY